MKPTCCDEKKGAWPITLNRVGAENPGNSVSSHRDVRIPDPFPDRATSLLTYRASWQLPEPHRRATTGESN